MLLAQNFSILLQDSLKCWPPATWTALPGNMLQLPKLPWHCNASMTGETAGNNGLNEIDPLEAQADG